MLTSLTQLNRSLDRLQGSISAPSADMIECLPVELIAKIVAELALQDVVNISQLSRRLKHVASDPLLNVWRLPILRNLRSNEYEDTLKHLSVYTSVPRHNWVEILSMGRASYILFETTLPNLTEAEWEEAFVRFVSYQEAGSPSSTICPQFLGDFSLLGESGDETVLGRRAF